MKKIFIPIILALVVISILAAIVTGPAILMIVANAYSNFIISITSNQAFEKEFASIPTVNLFIQKYPNYTTSHDSDFLGWKIIDYVASHGDKSIRLHVKKSVLHNGIHVAISCNLDPLSDDSTQNVMHFIRQNNCLDDNNALIHSYIMPTCNKKENLPDMGCFVESYQNCTVASIQQTRYTVESDPISALAIIEKDVSSGECKMHIHYDSKDKHGFQGEYDSRCSNVRLDKGYSWIIDQCEDKDHSFEIYVAEQCKHCRTIS